MSKTKFSDKNIEARLADYSRIERLHSVYQTTKDPRAKQLAEALELTFGRPSGLQKNKFSDIKGKLRKAIDAYLEAK